MVHIKFFVSITNLINRRVKEYDFKLFTYDNSSNFSMSNFNLFDCWKYLRRPTHVFLEF